MVLALDGDSTMTSFVPPLFFVVFAVLVLAGTLFPSCNLRHGRL